MKVKKQSTDSDSSEDENADLLREAVDPTFFNDAMYKKTSAKKSPVIAELPKSQRYLLNEEQHSDVRVSADMQIRIGKKVSEIIGDKIKFVDVKTSDPIDVSIEGGVKLFSDSTAYLSEQLPEEVLPTKESRKKIKKRKLQEEVEASKDDIQSIVVSADHVLSDVETKHWKSRRKEKVYRYKKDGPRVLTLLED